MIFDYYEPFFSKKAGRMCPGVTAKEMSWERWEQIGLEPRLFNNVQAFQNGNKDAKLNLPAICWMGKSVTGKRIASDMQPTGLVMLDIDHVENPREVFDNKIQPKLQELKNILLVHITPSGKGLRVVFENEEGFDTVVDNMGFMYDKLELESAGDFDSAVKDLSRLSFIVPRSMVLFEANELFQDHKVFIKKVEQPTLFKDEGNVPPFTDKEEEEFSKMEYRGTFVREIVDKYIEVKGEPGDGEKHNFYNEMVKNFRCILDNNKRKLLYVLPRFGHTIDECWSQIVSICRVNTLSRLPVDFYYFLKDNGFYKPKGTHRASEEEQYMLKDEEEKVDESLPPLPPVFRELIGCCPKDFVVPSVNALLPILGTLTSYLRATYPFDNREHSTSFFSVIYAPPGTGKGFVERYIDILFEDLKYRDLITSLRENIYLKGLRQRSANEKAPDEPHVSTRLIPAKNSEAEFLMKQRDNHGYHMFTYAAEMDSWAKGVKAAGGNKDDMIRIAWDNGEYGQQFRSANTFKGTVRLFWNVLITGTLNQVNDYFKNVENGLVTRCSFSTIENQEFAEAPLWRPLTKKHMAVIRKFMRRCDERTYTKPAEVYPELEDMNDDEFNNEVDWRFQFRDFQRVDMSWIMPTIKAFLKEELEKSVLDVDRARDVFRRRVAVRGFRLALLCMGLWEKPNEANKNTVKKFVTWWMKEDMKGIMSLFAERYNTMQDGVLPSLRQRSVYDALPDKFSKADLYSVCMKQGIKTQLRKIIYEWKRVGSIEKTGKDEYNKKKGTKK